MRIWKLAFHQKRLCPTCKKQAFFGPTLIIFCYSYFLTTFPHILALWPFIVFMAILQIIPQIHLNTLWISLLYKFLSLFQILGGSHLITMAPQKLLLWRLATFQGSQSQWICVLIPHIHSMWNTACRTFRYNRVLLGFLSVSPWCLWIEHVTFPVTLKLCGVIRSILTNG